jgi:hypothetical protein
MKQLLFLSISLMLSGGVFAQSQNVGIGTKTPNESALLDLSSENKGLLIPRLTDTQKAGIINPAEGLLIYQTNGKAGFYFFEGNT